MMDVLEAIRNRRSTRDFAAEVPSRQAIEALICLATEAPSAANRQFWSFCVVSDQALLDRISQAAKTYMTRFRPVDLPENLYEKLADPAFHIFYHAPVLILISAKKNAPWKAEDCALAAQNLMLGAVASNFGTCWIGLCQPFLDTPEGRALIGISDDETPIAPIAMGRPASQSDYVVRKQPQIRWIT
ncbi:nitroreductase family protein [Methylocystis sp.]|uniref:nitroreductase family protein n=1 Tax=Methylocystis sp. TaxID=1911079 RepID=UPI0025F3C3C1|nr:nitroreductase family protein [Methylocystis sp.]